jgi:hypothetical protein
VQAALRRINETISGALRGTSLKRHPGDGMENEPMTLAEQAVLLWPLLALAARTQQILSYAAVEGYTGIARHELNRALGLIHKYCERRGWPLLNTLVVSQQSGMPGKGLPADLSSLEIKVEQGWVPHFPRLASVPHVNHSAVSSFFDQCTGGELLVNKINTVLSDFHHFGALTTALTSERTLRNSRFVPAVRTLWTRPVRNFPLGPFGLLGLSFGPKS